MIEKVKKIILGQGGGIKKLINLVPAGFLAVSIMLLILGFHYIGEDGNFILMYLGLTSLMIACLTGILFNLRNVLSTVCFCLSFVPYLFLIGLSIYFGEVDGFFITLIANILLYILFLILPLSAACIVIYLLDLKKHPEKKDQIKASLSKARSVAKDTAGKAKDAAASASKKAAEVAKDTAGKAKNAASDMAEKVKSKDNKEKTEENK